MEVLVALAITSMLIPVVIISLGNYFEDNISSLASTTQDTDTHSALGTIAKDLQSTLGFRTSLDIASVTPLGSTIDATGNGAWSYCSTGSTSTTCDGITTNNYTTNRVLIAYTNATDGPTTESQRLPVFINDGSPTFNLFSAQIATNAYIYFVAKDSTNTSQYNLYRRIIVDVNPYTNVFRNVSTSSGLWPCSTSNPTYSSCSTPYQKTSCASTLYSTYTSQCKAKDAVLLYNIESFWVDYYDSTNQKIANYYTNVSATASTVDAAVQNIAKSVQLTITKKLSNYSKKTSVSTLRILRQ